MHNNGLLFLSFGVLGKLPDIRRPWKVEDHMRRERGELFVQGLQRIRLHGFNIEHIVEAISWS